jgi:hypothetical protein
VGDQVQRLNSLFDKPAREVDPFGIEPHHPELVELAADLRAEPGLTIQMRDRSVELGPGELFVIPRGTEHCPVAREEARFL